MILTKTSDIFKIVYNVEGPGTIVFFCKFSDIDNLEFNPLKDILQVEYLEQKGSPLVFEFQYWNTRERRQHPAAYEMKCKHNKLVKCMIEMD